jgi:solute carrier family 32 (vesicular inhibitory amino acid transporter)
LFPCVQVLLVSSVLCSLNYALTAVLGYKIYGDNVQALVTLNLPSGKMYTKIAILTTLITPLAKYSIVTQPITTRIEEKLSLAKYSIVTQPITTRIEEKLSLAGQGGLTRAAVSTAVLASTVVVACTVPFFGYLMSFIGSSLNVTVAVLFPCLCYLKIFMHRGVGRAEVAAVFSILVIGVCIALVGTYTSVQQIVGTL